jgi:hypothetical protein
MTWAREAEPRSDNEAVEPARPGLAAIRVGLMGASASTQLPQTLRQGFAGSGVQFVSLTDVDGQAYRAALRSSDLVQVTAFDTSRHWALPALRARLLGKPVVRYWVGTDVLHMRNSTSERARSRAADCLVSANVATWHNLRKELRSMGIASRVIPAPHQPALAKPVDRLPQRLTALAYLSVRPWKWELYGGDVVMALARKHPEWRFLIVNHTGEGLEPPANVEFLSRVPAEQMDGVYRRASVLLRVNRHDGLPRMILEALARGLHVVWSQPLPHCHTATNCAQAEAVLADLARTPRVNTAGSEYVAREFHPRLLAARWRHLYRQLCRR